MGAQTYNLLDTSFSAMKFFSGGDLPGGKLQTINL